MKLLPALLLLAATAAADQPDTTGIIGVTHRFGMAHACPMSETLALTNAHVADPYPLEKSAPLMAMRWNGGVLNPLSVSWVEDLALMARPDAAGKFPRFYPQAQVAPLVGEQVWWVGFDWSKKTKAARPKVFSGNVVTVDAGFISLDRSTPKGSSGSCVLNAKGEVVGIIAWGMELDDKEEAAFAVAVYGKWFDSAKAEQLLKDKLAEAEKANQ